MGSDDIFHKRRAKSERELRRGAARRAVYEKVLIVCEGSKTEPLYFGEIKDAFEISTANIRISGDCGSDPLSVGASQDGCRLIHATNSSMSSA